MKSGTGKKTPAALAVSALAAAMLLAGCGGDTKPTPSASNKTTPSPTATAAPTASISPTAVATRTTDPKIPAAARAHTIAGAEAFVRYFIKRSNEAWTGPHPGILAPLCQATTIACRGFEEDATRLAKEGHRYDGDPVTIEFIGVLDATNPKKFDVLANLIQEERNEIDSAGKVYVKDKRKRLRLNFELIYTGRAWSVAAMKVVK